MTEVAPTATINARASMNIRAVVLPRAQWETEYASDGRQALRPQKGTWHAHVVRGRAAHDVTVVPFIGCPNCGGLSFLSHTPAAARALRGLTRMPVPVAHAIDHLGRVSPDVQCGHGRCDFHRKLVLDRWNKTKRLFAVAYVEALGRHGEIKIDYCHANDRREAMFHFGNRPNCRIIDAGPAVGFFVDEKTGKVTAD